MIKRLFKLGVVVILMAVLLGTLILAVQYWRARQIREALWEAFTPVQVTNCELKRYGSPNDGGYLLCANLLTDATSGYSYGINGEDAWGCAVATELSIPMHQYDCFNTNKPVCSPDRGVFHNECIGAARETVGEQLFDTLANQFQKNGDTGTRKIMKMDVEGAEWQSLLTAPDSVLSEIDQLAIEFHEVEKASFLDTAARLKQFFYVAHYHQNNFLCEQGFDPFPGQVFELLLVNRRLAQVDESRGGRITSPHDAPNTMAVPDCQPGPAKGEFDRIAGWMSRKIQQSRQWLSDHRIIS